MGAGQRGSDTLSLTSGKENGFPSLPTSLPSFKLTGWAQWSFMQDILIFQAGSQQTLSKFLKKKKIVGFQPSLSCVDVDGIESMR